jgi:hypothetical protein
VRSRSLLLRKSEENKVVTFHLYYEGDLKPEDFLIERDVLAAFFDSCSNPLYVVECGTIHAEFVDFRQALERYYELVVNWKGVETYVHPKIFYWDQRWVEGVQRPLGES